MQFKHDLDPKKFKIGVVGAGGWGTALANLLASKGIENKTHLTMTGVLKETLAGIPVLRLVAISGPSFAREVACHLATVVTVASKREAVNRLMTRDLKQELDEE